MTTETSLRPWWGTFSLDVGGAHHYTVGPLHLWIERRVGEVRTSWWSGDDPLASDLVLSDAGDVPDIPDEPGMVVQRFSLPGGPAEFSVGPMLADRDVVVSPEELISILPGRRVTLYISSPLWFRVALEADTRVPLVEAPTYRPSDTWFGPNTRQGELCYWSRVRARLSRENLPLRPHRAATALVVDNRASTPFPIDRLRLPLPLLSLFATPEGRIWTDTVTVTRKADGTSLDIDTTGPPDEPDATRLEGPRRKVERHVFTRLEGLFAPLGGRRHGRLGRLPWS